MFMFLSFIFQLVFSFNAYAITGEMSSLDDTGQEPCQESLTESFENLSEETKSAIDQILKLKVDKADKIIRAVNTYFKVRGPSRHRFSDEEKLLAIKVVEAMEGNVTGSSRLLDMSNISLRDWVIEYEQKTGTQIRNTTIQRTYSDKQKAETIKIARKEGVPEASRAFKIPAGTIRSWLRRYATKAAELAIKEGVPEAARQLNETHSAIYKLLNRYKIRFAKLASKEGVSEVARKLNQSEETIIMWMEEFGFEVSNYTEKEKNIKPVLDLDRSDPSGELSIRVTVHEGVEESGVKIGKVYTEEFKAKVLQRATEVGAPEAAKEFGISTDNIYDWTKKYEVEIKQILEKYTEEFKAKVLQRAAEVGASEATREFGISIGVIYNLAKKYGVEIKKIRETYPDEFKVEIVQRATEVGVTETSREFGVSKQSIYDWAEKFGVEIKNNRKTKEPYTEEFRIEVLQRAKEVGVPKASREFGVSEKSIRNWEKKYGIEIKQIRKPYPEEFKAEVVQRAKEIGTPKASKEFNVPMPTITKWLKNGGENNNN